MTAENTDPTDSFMCLNNPWHAYPPTDPTRCRWCGSERTAAEAITSLLAGYEGWSEEVAAPLVAKHAEEAAADAVPLAMVRMNPHGHAAALAGQILAHADVLQDALAALADPDEEESRSAVRGRDMDTVRKVLGLVSEFREHVDREEREIGEYVKGKGKRPVWDAPLTGTSERDLVKVIADSFLYKPQPAGDEPWYVAVREQIFAVGGRYEQVWKADTSFYRYLEMRREEP